MARIACPLCDKTFRNPSGLSWHMSHIHPPTATASMAMSVAMDPVAAERVSLEGVEPDIGDQADASELSALLEELEEKVDAAVSASRETEDHIEELGPRLEAAEWGLESIGAMQGKVVKLREAFTGVRSDVDMLRSVVASLCRLVWELDQNHSKKHRAGDQWANHPTAEEIEEARQTLRGVLGIYPASVERALAAIQRQNGKLDEYLRILG